MIDKLRELANMFSEAPQVQRKSEPDVTKTIRVRLTTEQLVTLAAKPDTPLIFKVKGGIVVQVVGTPIKGTRRS